MTEAIDYVKTELMPDFDFDAFNHEYNDAEGESGEAPTTTSNESQAPVIEMIHETIAPTPTAEIVEEVVETPIINPTATEEVDKW